MSSAKDKPRPYDEIIADLLRSAPGPVPVTELARGMSAVHPSQAKNPQQAMRHHIREAAGRQLVFLDDDTVLPLRLAWQGTRFRVPLDRKTTNKGLMHIGNSLGAYLPMNFPLEQVRLMDMASKPISYEPSQVSEKVNLAFGHTTATVTTWHADLTGWFRAENVTAQDHLLFTISDWERGILQLECESFSQIDPVRRTARNQLLADLFYALLDSAAKEAVYVREAVPTVYARLADKSGYPPDHWMAVLAADGRMTSDGWRIHYSDGGFSPLELMFRDLSDEPRLAKSQRTSKEQGAQVYRFKAALANRPSLWRRIEIQGKHSLADLDVTLRGAFNHDVLDHLGGFWKLVSRGGSDKAGAKKRPASRPGRYREVELGDVDPMGGGDGAKTKIASLDLAVGDKMKYVYDFGDWIEHWLVLEAVDAPLARAKYPREVDRNQPKYVDCVECQADGRQTAAKFICLECSTSDEQDIWLCEACSEGHEEHYLEEILY